MLGTITLVVRVAVRRTVVLATAFFILIPAANSAPSGEARVLVVHSYRSGYEWTDLLTRGLVTELVDADLDVRTDIEFMDSGRRPSEGAQFAAWLRQRYGGQHLDALVAFDDASARFLSVEYPDLFPGVPVVFGGVSDHALIAQMPRHFCGIEETFDLRSTVDLAVRLHPETHNLYLIVGDSPFSQALSAMFTALEPKYPNIRFVWLNGERMGREALYEELRKVAPADPVFLISFVTDRQGHVPPKRMLENVASASAGPVWAVASTELGQGLFAGRTNGGEHHGRLTGQALLKVLHGASPEAVGRTKEGDSPLIFDRRELARRGISPARLPQNAVIWNPDPSLWDRYRWWIVAAMTFLLLQTALIVALARTTLRRRRAEEALTKSNRELAAALRSVRDADEGKGRFLANMSHEIRTPMNGIVGSAELLADSPLTPEQREGVETIRGSAVALLNLLNDLLDLSRMGANRMTIESVAYSPSALLEEVARMMSPQAKREHLRLDFQVSESVPPQAIGDPLRIRQVLLNLVGNALKFTPQGRVDLYASVEPHRDGMRLRFEVADTGPGIPERDREAVFVRFRQLDSSHARRYGGAGLGLAISKELVTAMGGEIGVESEAGKGCRFWFAIPTGVPADREDKVTPDGAVRVVS